MKPPRGKYGGSASPARTDALGKLFGWGVYSGKVLRMVLPLAAVTAVTGLFFSLLVLSESKPLDVAGDFQRFTGWMLPADSHVLRAKSTHGGFLPDGDYNLVVQVKPAQLERWLAASADDWTDTPIPKEIRNAFRNAPDIDGQIYRATLHFRVDGEPSGTVIAVDPRSGLISIYEFRW